MCCSVKEIHVPMYIYVDGFAYVYVCMYYFIWWMSVFKLIVLNIILFFLPWVSHRLFCWSRFVQHDLHQPSQRQAHLVWHQSSSWSEATTLFLGPRTADSEARTQTAPSFFLQLVQNTNGWRSSVRMREWNGGFRAEDEKWLKDEWRAGRTGWQLE